MPPCDIYSLICSLDARWCFVFSQAAPSQAQDELERLHQSNEDDREAFLVSGTSRLLSIFAWINNSLVYNFAQAEREVLQARIGDAEAATKRHVRLAEDEKRSHLAERKEVASSVSPRIINQFHDPPIPLTLSRRPSWRSRYATCSWSWRRPRT